MNRAEARQVLTNAPLEEIRARCTDVRMKVSGRKVSLCSICNARNGACSENCAYCAQSGSPGTGWTAPAAVRNARLRATEAGAERFSMVTSGRGITSGELWRIREMITGESGLCELCASMGIVSLEVLTELRASGITRYHHNLETSESFFSRICSTHSWKERRKTAEQVLEAGLSLCSGGIIGLGESDRDRIDLAFSLRDLGADSIALNFYVDVPGAVITGELPNAEKLLRIISMFRLVNPQSELRICAGRTMLGIQEPEMFDFGVTGLMTGDLLTTPGSVACMDRELIEKAGYSA